MEDVSKMDYEQTGTED